MRTSPSRLTASPTATEAAVLGLLRHGERSGYDLKKLARGSVGYFWAPARTQIYAILPRLEAAGLAASRTVAQKRRPPKQLYRLTDAGREMLDRWLEEGPIGPEPDRSLLLLKVFFGDAMRPERLLEQIRERRGEAEQLLAELDEIDEIGRGRADDFFPALTRRYGREWAEAVCRWADHAERELGRRIETGP